MNRMPYILATLVALLMAGVSSFAGEPVFGPTGRVLPKIDIVGLDGAAHWLFFEAEDISDYYFSYGGSLNFSAATRDSGRRDTQEKDYVRWDGFEGSWMRWENLHIPADMAAPKMLVNFISEFRNQFWTVHVPLGATSQQPLDPCAAEATRIGDYHLYLWQDALGTWGTGSDSPIKWVDTQLGAIAAGDQDFGILLNTEPGGDGGGSGGGYDNFLLYDGQIDPNGHGTTVEYGAPYNMSWKSDNHSADYKSLGVDPVTPAITVSGAASYVITLNGEPYTPGTEISEPGNYRLTIIANGYDDGSLIQQRIMAGADFNIAACGDAAHPYPVGDLNKDCYANLVDLGLMVAQWLDCTDPDAPCNYSPVSDEHDVPVRFPIGWYVGPGYPHWLPEIQADSAVYNCTNPYGRMTGYLNVSEELNMGVIQYVYDGPLQRDGNNDPLTVATLTDTINTWKAHPAIRYWNIADEPEISSDPIVTVANFEASYNAIKAADPTRLVTAVFADAGHVSSGGWMNHVDFPMFDAYPVNSNDAAPAWDMYKVASDTKTIADLATAAGKGAPIFVAQAHADAGFNLRFPTEFETRYMSFAPITVGARGLLYFAYNLDAANALTPERRAINAKIAEQLSAVVPAIESAEGQGGVTVTSTRDSDTTFHGVNDVTYLFRKLGGDYYLIAVNNTASAKNSVIFTLSTLPTGSYTADVVDENRSIGLVDGGGGVYTLTDNFTAYDVHVYEINLD